MILGRSLSIRRFHLLFLAISMLIVPLGLGGFDSTAIAQEGAEPEQAEIAIEGIAEPPATKGWDKKIDEAFKPIADWFGYVVFYPAPTKEIEWIGADIPIVVIVLVVGACFFTLFFGFINIRLFPLAIRIVSGKYDDIDDEDDLQSATESGGDKQDDDHGEVSHFQALATAVSGTVGLGNIAGVAEAIAMGGPGATFWIIVCGLLPADFCKSLPTNKLNF